MSVAKLEALLAETALKNTPGAELRAMVMSKVLAEKKSMTSKRPAKGSEEAKAKMAMVRGAKKAKVIEEKLDMDNVIQPAKRRGRGHPHYLHHLDGGNADVNNEMYKGVMKMRK